MARCRKRQGRRGQGAERLRRNIFAPAMPAGSPSPLGRLPGIWIPAADDATDSGPAAAIPPRPIPRPPAEGPGAPLSGPVEFPNFMPDGKVTTTGCPGAFGN